MEFVFSSSQKLKLVEFLLENPSVELKARELGRNLKISPALVSNTLKFFRKEKLLDGKKINRLHPMVKSLKIFLNVKKLEDSKLVEEIKKIFKDCTGIGLFGSWANGLNDKNSDLDSWVKISKNYSDKQVVELRKFAKQKLGVEANFLVLDNQRIKALKEKDFVFYSSLFNSFILWGGQID